MHKECPLTVANEHPPQAAPAEYRGFDTCP